MKKLLKGQIAWSFAYGSDPEQTSKHVNMFFQEDSIWEYFEKLSLIIKEQYGNEHNNSQKLW